MPGANNREEGAVVDDNHIFTCVKRKAHRRSIINQIKTLRTTVDENLCDILITATGDHGLLFGRVHD